MFFLKYFSTIIDDIKKVFVFDELKYIKEIESRSGEITILTYINKSKTFD